MTRYQPTISGIKKKLGTIHWPLLLFLVGFLNVKLYVKIAAIFFAAVLHRKNPIPRDLFRKKWIGFYLSMPLIAGINLLTSPSSLSVKSLLAFSLGCGYWIMAMVAAWHIFLFVREERDKEKLHRTVTLFFGLNMLIVLAGFLYICIDAGSINPYTYRGQHQKYFINTGDFISGISLDSSVTTALISAFGVFYFLYRGKKGWSLLSLLAVLLAASNWIDLLLIGCFGVIFFFRTNWAQRRMILLYLSVIFVFMLKVSPENRDYAMQILGRISGRYAYLIPPPLPQPKMIDLIEKKDVVAKRKELGSLVNTLYTKDFRDSIHKKYTGWNYSGRMIAWKELGNFYREHPGRLLLGTGMGNFSSRIAFKTAALGIDGGYPQQQRYIHPYFRDNHLYIYLYYHSNDQGQHSIVNKPNSVYGQLLGEYGLAGIACFLVFYLGFFIPGIRSRTYGLPLLLLMSAAFLTEYWFEQLSIVVLFEFLMLLDQPATPDPQRSAYDPQRSAYDPQPITPNPPTPNWKP
jgi:hypothetical protein